MSERRRRKAPTDYPVARGVSPPPSSFTFGGATGKVVLRRPAGKPTRAGRGRLAIEIAGVAVLAGFFMAAGWWLFDRRTDSVTPAASASREREQPLTEPKPPAATAEPAAPIPAPAPAPVAHAPDSPLPSPPPAPVPNPLKPAAPVVTSLTFQRDILPILKTKCLNCHGDNKRKLKGGLDVSTVRLLEKGGDGGPALNRQQPELSLLWETVASGQMPPGKGNKLTESEKKKLHDWIVGGGR